MGLALREHELAVDDDIEHTTASLDEYRLEGQLASESGRQTGGLREVVSLHAVGDFDRHVLTTILQRIARRQRLPRQERLEVPIGFDGDHAPHPVVAKPAEL